MKIIFITLLMGLLSLFKAGATEDISVLSNEDKKEIELQGTTEEDRPKSLIIPFEASQIGNSSICITSLQQCTAVTIYIMDAYGCTIDTHTSSLMPQQTLTFNISGYANGIYTLTITTPQGTCLSGMFEIE